MKNNSIDAMDAEDVEYYKNANFPDDEWLPAEEIPWIKAYQEKKGIRRMYVPRKRSVTAKIDEDVLTWLKHGGRGYQTRMNAILRDAMIQSLQQQKA